MITDSNGFTKKFFWTIYGSNKPKRMYVRESQRKRKKIRKRGREYLVDALQWSARVEERGVTPRRWRNSTPGEGKRGEEKRGPLALALLLFLPCCHWLRAKGASDWRVGAEAPPHRPPPLCSLRSRLSGWVSRGKERCSSPLYSSFTPSIMDGWQVGQELLEWPQPQISSRRPSFLSSFPS